MSVANSQQAGAMSGMTKTCIDVAEMALRQFDKQAQAQQYSIGALGQAWTLIGQLATKSSDDFACLERAFQTVRSIRESCFAVCNQQESNLVLTFVQETAVRVALGVHSLAGTQNTATAKPAETAQPAEPAELLAPLGHIDARHEVLVA